MKSLIKNYEWYEIYDDGNIYNTQTKQWLKGSISENGYKYYRLSKNGVKKMFYAHILVATHFIPNPNNYPIVDHINGNKLDNNVSNLRWSTYSDNMKNWHNLNKDKVRRPAEYYKDDLKNEYWIQFENYDISSCGRIKNHTTNRILKPSVVCGYYTAALSKNGLVTNYLIHNLVYTLFIGDIPNDKMVDHKDGNKLNNHIDNLRLLTTSENVKAALYEQKINKSAKKVGQYDKEGNLLNIFPSTREASRALDLDSSTISKVCRGQNKTHGGFIFKYID